MSWLRRRRGRAVGYVPDPVYNSRRWHTDPDCPESMWSRYRGKRRVTVRANTALLLARDMGALGITACRRCALPAILDEVAAGATKPGCHALICDLSRTDGACPRCADLSAHATKNGHLSATRTDGHVAVLREGFTALAANSLNTLWLIVKDASGYLPVITAPVWATAADLLAGPSTLGEALAAAAALHAPVASR